MFGKNLIWLDLYFDIGLKVFVILKYFAYLIIQDVIQWAWNLSIYHAICHTRLSICPSVFHRDLSCTQGHSRVAWAKGEATPWMKNSYLC